jgi:response regulator RpfG family c-di-GMP phosphodiesterase
MDTLLLVDDDAALLGSLQLPFLDERGIEVLTAASAKEAVYILARHPVDVIISDQHMPEIEGTEFLHFVREHYPDIQRIILSGDAGQQTTISAINKAEVFRFLVKPSNSTEIVATVRHALEIKGLKTANEQLKLEVQAQNKALETLNADLERTVAERTGQLRKTLESLKKQHANLQEQRTGVAEFLLALMGQNDHVKGRIARQILESVRLYTETSELKPSDELPYAAMIKVFVDPGLMDGDDTYLRLLASIEGFSPIAALIMGAEENYNGSGPIGSKGADIPWEARLLRIVSDFHTLNGEDLGSSREFILNRAGDIYDPDIARTFLQSRPDDVGMAATCVVEMDKLLPGMVVNRDIRLINGAVLVPAGVSLNGTMILQLKKVDNLVDGQITVFANIEKKRAE